MKKPRYIISESADLMARAPGIKRGTFWAETGPEPLITGRREQLVEIEQVPAKKAHGGALNRQLNCRRRRTGRRANGA